MIRLSDIKQLMQEVDDNVLTVYLHVDPGYQENQGTPPAWRIYLKNALKEAEKTFDDDTFDAMSKQIDEYLTGYEAQGKTLILFVSKERLIDYHMPVALENTHATGKPLITPAIWAIDEHEPYLIALVDGEKARLVSAYLGFASEQDRMTTDIDEYDFRQKTLMPNVTPGGNHSMRVGSAKDQHDETIKAHLHRFYKDVASNIQSQLKDMAASRLILGGSERSAHEVADLLHESVKENLVAVMSMPVDTPDHEIGEHIEDAALNYERDHETSLIDEVIGLAKAEGRAVLGEDAINKALEMGQVELLILPYPANDDALRKLTVRAFEVGAEIELVHDEPAAKLKEEGGVAARLYYTVETA